MNQGTLHADFRRNQVLTVLLAWSAIEKTLSTIEHRMEMQMYQFHRHFDKFH